MNYCKVRGINLSIDQKISVSQISESESAIHDGEVESSDVSTSNVEIGNLTPENSLESAKRLSQQNGFSEFTVVKVEEEQQQLFELLQGTGNKFLDRSKNFSILNFRSRVSSSWRRSGKF